MEFRLRRFVPWPHKKAEIPATLYLTKWTESLNLRTCHETVCHPFDFISHSPGNFYDAGANQFPGTTLAVSGGLHRDRHTAQPRCPDSTLQSSNCRLQPRWP